MEYEVLLKILVFIQIAIIWSYVYKTNRKAKEREEQLELVRKMMYEGIE